MKPGAVPPRVRRSESLKRLPLHVRVPGLAPDGLRRTLQEAQETAEHMAEPGGSGADVKKRATRLRRLNLKLQDALAELTAPIDVEALLARERAADACASPISCASPLLSAASSPRVWRRRASSSSASPRSPTARGGGQAWLFDADDVLDVVCPLPSESPRMDTQSAGLPEPVSPADAPADVGGGPHDSLRQAPLRRRSVSPDGAELRQELATLTQSGRVSSAHSDGPASRAHSDGPASLSESWSPDPTDSGDKSDSEWEAPVPQRNLTSAPRDERGADAPVGPGQGVPAAAGQHGDGEPGTRERCEGTIESEHLRSVARRQHADATMHRRTPATGAPRLTAPSVARPGLMRSLSPSRPFTAHARRTSPPARIGRDALRVRAVREAFMRSASEAESVRPDGSGRRKLRPSSALQLSAKHCSPRVEVEGQSSVQSVHGAGGGAWTANALRRPTSAMPDVSHQHDGDASFATWTGHAVSEHRSCRHRRISCDQPAGARGRDDVGQRGGLKCRPAVLSATQCRPSWVD